MSPGREESAPSQESAFQTATNTQDSRPDQGHPGGEWVFSAPDQIAGIWGNGQEIAWPTGEALIICGSDGSGKTSLIQNVIVRQLGIVTTPFLGLTVMPRTRIVYLAQDRPRQAKRALRRLVGHMDEEVLDLGLRVMDWPLDTTLEDDPDLLVRVGMENDAYTIYVDSLKDVVRELVSEESGMAIRRAYARACAAGIEVCLLHHDRKPGQDSRRQTLKLADVYGSRFITAGAGSVIALNGGSGDPLIELRHLKQPAEEVGPLKVAIDFETGEMTIWEGGDLASVLRAAGQGLTANDAARHLYATEAPTSKERERARRKLETVVAAGHAHKQVGAGPKDPARYFTVEVQATLRLAREGA